MDSQVPPDRRRGAWRTLFFITFSLFLLFWAWVLTAVASGLSPVSLMHSLLPPRNRDAAAPEIPVSRYVDEEYGVSSIMPADNRTASINGNGRRIVIAFLEPMDADTSHVLTSYSVDSAGEESLDFRNFAWPDAATFLVTFNRDLGPKERVSLTFRFRKAGGAPMRSMRLTYD